MIFLNHSAVVKTVFVGMLLLSEWGRGQDLNPAKNWTRFRGADGTGVVADDPRLPTTWDTKKNVKWSWRSAIVFEALWMMIHWDHWSLLTLYFLQSATKSPQSTVHVPLAVCGKRLHRKCIVFYVKRFLY